MTLNKLAADLEEKIVALGTYYRSHKMDNEFLNHYKFASAMAPFFKFDALINYYLFKQISNKDYCDLSIPAEDLIFIEKHEAGIRFVKFLNFFNQVVLYTNKIYPSYTQYKSPFEIYDQVRNAVNLNIGYSFIRIGDGEGSLLIRKLMQSSGVNSDYTQLESSRWLRLLGITDVDHIMLDHIFHDLIDAIKISDSHGGFCFDDEERSFELCRYSAELNFYEAYFGFLGSRALLRFCEVQSIYPVINMNETFSIEKIKELVSFTNSKPVFIGPVDIRSKLNIDDAYFFQISPRYIDKSIYGTRENIQPIMLSYKNFIENNLNKEFCSGRLFFVSAGIAGKIICGNVKKLGGIGLDIGSATDYIHGYGSRS